MTARFGFNVSGQRIGDAKYFYDFMRRLKPTWALVMDEQNVAQHLYEATEGQTQVIYRIWSEQEGRQWQTQSPKSYATELMAQGDKHLWKYVLNEPMAGSEKDIRRMSDWIARVIEIMTDSGHRVVAGNYSVGSWQEWMINKGVYDNLLKVLSERKQVAKLGVHEYTAIVLPFGVGAWDRWDMLDREKMQPHHWPRLDTVLPNGQMLGNYTHEQVPITYHLLRSHWFQRRVVDVLNLDPVEFVLTEFGWDRMRDLSEGQNHIFDALLKRYGASNGHHELHGAYTLRNVWKYYWPNWTTSEAIFEQFKWSQSIYSSDYLGILPFMWSFNDDWDQRGFNFGADKDLHELMIQWASQIRKDAGEPVPDPEPHPAPPIIEPDSDDELKDDFSNILDNPELTGFQLQEVVTEKSGRERQIEAPDNWTWVYAPQTDDPGEVPAVFHRDSGMGVSGGYIPWWGGFEQDQVQFAKGQRYLARGTTIQNYAFASEGNFATDILWRFVITETDEHDQFHEHYSPWFNYGGEDWQNKAIENLWVFEPEYSFIGSFRYECHTKWGNTHGEMLWTNIACQNAPTGYRDDIVQFIGQAERPDPTPIPDPVIEVPVEIDVLEYVRGDGRTYDVEYHFPGGPGSGIERMQTQSDGRRWFQVKGGVGATEYNWEEMFYTDKYVYRGTDTSPNETEYYQVEERNQYGQRWMPRTVSVGTLHYANPLITHRYKANGEPVSNKPPYFFPHWIEVKNIHPTYTFESGITLPYVLEIWAYTDKNGAPYENFERAFYAKDFGLVGWQAPDKGWKSHFLRPVADLYTLPKKVIPSIQLPELLPEDQNMADDNTGYFPLNDNRWTPVWVSSSGSHGTNMRQRPTVESPRVGSIYKDYPSLILKEEKRVMVDGIWYPVRINTQPELDHQTGDFSNFGWIRSDVFTYRDYTPPAPKPEPNPTDKRTVDIHIEYDVNNETHATIAKALRSIADVIMLSDVAITVEEDDIEG